MQFLRQNMKQEKIYWIWNKTMFDGVRRGHEDKRLASDVS